MNKNLEVVVQESQLEPAESKTLLEKFGDYEVVAKEWESKAKMIVVTDASQETEIGMAKMALKKFAQMRIDVEKSRKAMKEQSLRKGQAIDAVAKFLVSLIEPIETHLKLQANFVKIQEEKAAEEKRLAEEKKLEEERILAEEKRLKEEKRLREENEKMKEEMAKKEKEAQKAKEKVDRDALEAKKKADAELAKMREEQEKKIANEKKIAAEKEAELNKKIKRQKDLAELAKLEKEEKERQLKKAQEALIECPNCHHKFNLNHESL